MINLYKGDCLDIMNTIKDNSIDCIICDLPYGTTACTWDIIIPFDKLWEHYDRICKPNTAIILFGQEPFSSLLRTSNLEDYKYDIYWEKERLTNINQVKKRVGKTIETISIFYKKQCTYNPQMLTYKGKPIKNSPTTNSKLGKLTDNTEKIVKAYQDNGNRYPTQIWKFNRDCLNSNVHPTQKPIALLEELVKTYSNEGDTILDNCMGSGTTGVACKLLNRNFIGIEKEEQYFNIAEDRINNSTINNVTYQTEISNNKNKLF